MNVNDNILPLNIKRNKENKFTEKRNPYKKYQKAKWNWSDIFNEIESLKDESKIFVKISQKYNINYGTLKNKYCKFKNNKSNEYDNENRGVHKIFTENEEREIFNFLKENFIDKNKVLCNDIIKFYALKKSKELNLDKTFNASDGWCDMFKKRWNLSTVKISISRIATKTYNNDEISLFLKECEDSLIKVGENFFSI